MDVSSSCWVIKWELRGHFHSFCTWNASNYLFLTLLIAQLLIEVKKNPNNFQSTCQRVYANPRTRSSPTFVVEEALHLHGRPGVGDAQHGAGHNSLLGRGAVRGAHQAPVRLVVESLQNLHSLASAHRQLPATAVAGHEVMDHHCQLTASGQLKWREDRNKAWSGNN